LHTKTYYQYYVNKQLIRHQTSINFTLEAGEYIPVMAVYSNYFLNNTVQNIQLTEENKKKEEEKSTFQTGLDIESRQLPF
jgi:pyruvate/2-oxoacid:ferredoxin oxidoreductase alpha subunit